jgi:hypothetical protein
MDTVSTVTAQHSKKRKKGLAILVEKVINSLK